MPRLRPFLTAAIIALGASALYLPNLAGAPYYLNRDEMFFGLTAHSLATTGVDANGHSLPLYTQSPMRYGSEMWFQPALMYSAALSVKLFGLTEGTIRLPMTLMAIIDVVLMYLIGRRLFKRELPAIGAAILLAITPAHYIHSRVAMDFQAPLPFVLAWLFCTLVYLDTRRTRWLCAAGLSLGFGLYTYIAAYMWMPVYGVLTVIALLVRREALSRSAVFIGACAIPALMCVPFLISHPTVIRDVMWHYDREQPQTAAGTELFLTYFDLERFARAAEVYRRFYSPRFLFIDGPNALWSAGVFLLPTAGLLVVGLVATLHRRGVESLLLLGGLLTAAIPASLVGDLDAIHRASAVLPFAVLIAVAGFDSLWRARTVAVNTVAFIAIWAVTIVLASVFHGYFPLAQASIRAATAPLAAAALCALLWSSGPAVLGATRFWLIAGATAGLMQVAYVAVGFERIAWLSVIVSAAALVACLKREPRDDRRALMAGALFAMAFSHFMFVHAEYLDFRPDCIHSRNRSDHDDAVRLYVRGAGGFRGDLPARLRRSLGNASTGEALGARLLVDRGAGGILSRQLFHRPSPSNRARFRGHRWYRAGRRVDDADWIVCAGAPSAGGSRTAWRRGRSVRVLRGGFLHPVSRARRSIRHRRQPAHRLGSSGR